MGFSLDRPSCPRPAYAPSAYPPNFTVCPWPELIARGPSQKCRNKSELRIYKNLHIENLYNLIKQSASRYSRPLIQDQGSLQDNPIPSHPVPQIPLLLICWSSRPSLCFPRQLCLILVPKILLCILNSVYTSTTTSFQFTKYTYQSFHYIL